MNENDIELLVDEQLAKQCRNVISEDEIKEFLPIMQDILHGMNGISESHYPEYLHGKFRGYLPEKSEEEISSYVADIIDSVKTSNNNLKSLNEAHQRGVSSEYWFAKETQKTVAHLSEKEQVTYFNILDQAIHESNVKMFNAITTQSSNINMNPNLDGFIAEQHHVNTFNVNAAAKGSNLHAEVVEHVGEGFTKNGFDVIVKDADGRRIQQYQAKYGATSKDTINLLKNGDYNNQRYLVPEEQVADVQKAFPNKTVTSTVEAEGIKSNPLTKEQAKELQNNAQNNISNPELSYNEIANKELLMGCTRQIGNATVMGAVIGAGADIFSKAINGEEIKAEEVVETAIKTGADTGVKVGVASAIKIGAEKGIIKAIPAGTPAGIIANVAFVAVENVKILGKVAAGEMTQKEGLSAMMDVTISAAVGFKGAAVVGNIGMAVGALFGPVGVVVGGIIGGAVGYMAGSAVGKAVSKGVKTVAAAAKTVVKTVGKAIVDTGGAIWNGVKTTVKSIGSGIKSVASSLFSRW